MERSVRSLCGFCTAIFKTHISTQGQCSHRLTMERTVLNEPMHFTCWGMPHRYLCYEVKEGRRNQLKIYFLFSLWLSNLFRQLCCTYNMVLSHKFRTLTIISQWILYSEHLFNQSSPIVSCFNHIFDGNTWYYRYLLWNYLEINTNLRFGQICLYC